MHRCKTDGAIVRCWRVPSLGYGGISSAILHSNFHDLPIQGGSRKQLKLPYRISFLRPYLDSVSANGLLDPYLRLSSSINRADASQPPLHRCYLISSKLRFSSTPPFIKGKARNDAPFDQETHFEIRTDVSFQSENVCLLYEKVHACMHVRLMILTYQSHNLSWIAAILDLCI